MRRPEPVRVLQLFPEVRRELLTLLAGLSAEDWAKPTACAKWSVKDIALHLLGGDIGILSRRRDAFTPAGKPIESWTELVALINELNDAWVVATRRVSPRMLCELLAWAGPQVEEYFSSLDPMAMGGPVDWAGPEAAPVWLDLAREYTERWHHQQQIRDAVGRAGVKQRRYFAPVLDTFVRGLPHAFREAKAAPGTMVKITISGESGGDWLLRREAEKWELFVDDGGSPSSRAAARVVLDQEDAWRLFTKGLSPTAARSRAQISGDEALALKVLGLVSIIG